MSEIAVVVGPFVPDAHASFLQPVSVGIALEEPQEFVDDRLQMEFFGSEKGESLFEVETHLMTKDRDGARAGPVALFDAFCDNPVEQVDVLLHETLEISHRRLRRSRMSRDYRL